jgi:hypothetical protein
MTNQTNNSTVTLELSVEDINVVLAGLGELPAKVSLSVIEKVRSQAVAQIQAANQEEAVQQ